MRDSKWVESSRAKPNCALQWKWSFSLVSQLSHRRRKISFCSFTVWKHAAVQHVWLRKSIKEQQLHIYCQSYRSVRFQQQFRAHPRISLVYRPRKKSPFLSHFLCLPTQITASHPPCWCLCHLFSRLCLVLTMHLNGKRLREHELCVFEHEITVKQHLRAIFFHNWMFCLQGRIII